MKILAIFLSVVFAVLQLIIGIFGSFANAVLNQIADIDDSDSDEETKREAAFFGHTLKPNSADYNDNFNYMLDVSRHQESHLYDD